MAWSAIKMLLALKCEESTRLVSEALDRELPAVERWAVRLHAVSCRSCRPFRRQVIFLRETLQQRFALESADSNDAFRLSDESRTRIARVIADRASEDSF